jgi:perosamine synthetase
MKDCIEQLVNVLKTSVGDKDRVVPLHEPTFEGNEWDYIKDCLDSGWVSSVGSYVDQFEASLSEYTGAPFAVATMNGTAALHTALLVCGVERGDEVLVPAVSFVATCNAIHYCGATPHFVDTNEETLGIHVAKLEAYLEDVVEIRNHVSFNRVSGKRISALMVVHTLGHAAHLDELLSLCQRYHLKLVEDAAEALGSWYEGSHVGFWGDVGVLSFNGNKVVTSGGGGALLTSSPELAGRAKHLTTTAKNNHRWNYAHDEVGYNYRLPNINAALGCAQLEQLPRFLKVKRELALRYQSKLNSVSGVRFIAEPTGTTSNYWLNGVWIEKCTLSDRDGVLSQLDAVGIQARPLWELLSKLPMNLDCPSMELSGALRAEASVLLLPSGIGVGNGWKP